MSENVELDGLQFLIRLLQLEKILPPLPTVNDALTAAFLGIDVDGLLQARRELADGVNAVAIALLADPAIATCVDRLPFANGETVVGFGDSLTADTQSWFEIVARIFVLRRPADQVQFINAGVSGETTAQMLARCPFVARARPSHVLCLAGGNDARHFGNADAPTQLSLTETQRNLVALRNSLPAARWLWLAPPAAVIESTRESPFWASMQTFWSTASLAAVSDLVCKQTGPVLDLRTLLGTPPLKELYLPDGLHPNLRGHALIARALLEKLGAV